VRGAKVYGIRRESERRTNRLNGDEEQKEKRYGEMMKNLRKYQAVRDANYDN